MSTATLEAAKARHVEVNKLRVDHRYQRPLNEKRVDKIVREFDPNQFGALSVAARPDGTYAVFEGQHRLHAARLMGHKKVLCLVHGGLSDQGEAELFVAAHVNRKNPTPADRFRARVFSGDPTAVAIQRVITECGFDVKSNAAGIGTIAAITAAEKAWRVYGEDAFRHTLSMLGDLWYEEPYATHGSMILGMARFLAQYKQRIDRQHTERLRAQVPLQIINAARTRREAVLALGISAELRKRTGIQGKPAAIGGVTL